MHTHATCRNSLTRQPKVCVDADDLLLIIVAHLRYRDRHDTADVDVSTSRPDPNLELGMSAFIRSGVYAFVAGPSYETVAECRFLEKIGMPDASSKCVLHR